MQQLCKSQIVKLQALKADTLKKEDTVYEISLKKSHSTLRAKRATFTKVQEKMPKGKKVFRLEHFTKSHVDAVEHVSLQ